MFQRLKSLGKCWLKFTIKALMCNDFHCHLKLTHNSYNMCLIYERLVVLLLPALTITYQIFVHVNVAIFYSLTVAPVFLTPPENLTVVAPEDATFFCEATARPGPAVTWWRVEGGVPVQLNDGINYTIVEGGTGERIRNSTLTVVGTEPSDALDYFCRTSNVAGVVEATAEITVHGE